jgi:NAD(P)H-flavin reductase
MTTAQLAPSGLGAAASLPVACRVQRIARETPDCWTLTLAPVDGGPRPAFAPGQFNMLYVLGFGEVPISMSGAAGPGERWVHTVRAVGGVTRALCALRPGATVGVRGPFGTPWPVARAMGRDVVVMAGGIGLAPLRPVILALIAERERFGRVAILYGARTPDDLLFRRQLASWRGRFDLQVDVAVDRARPGWHGHVGLVTRLVRHAHFSPDDAVAMICGPELMMRYSAAELTNRGMPADEIFVSMERNMKCAIGLCGHCQFGAAFTCLDGPVFPLASVSTALHRREL